MVQRNTDGHAGSEIHKLTNENSGKLLLKIETRRINKCSRNAAANTKNPRKKVFKDARSSKFYGPDVGRDMEERAFEAAKKVELARLDADRLNRELILKQTYGQRYCTKWFEVRKKLINNTYFARIVNAVSPKSYKNLLKEMLYSPAEFAKSAAVRYQLMYEKDALKYFSSNYRDHELQKTGIFIDKDKSYLGASPLRLYGREAIVMVKCPDKAYKMNFEEAISKNLLPYWKKKKGEDVSINLKGSWYIEIQGTLHVAQKNWLF